MVKLRGWVKVAHRLFIVLIVLAVLVPFYWLGVMSVSPQRAVAGRSIPAMFPVEPSLRAYQSLLFPPAEGGDGGAAARMYRRSLLNSVFVSSVSMIVAVIFGTMSAYAVSRLVFRGKKAIFALILGSRLVAQIAIAIPMFTVFRRLGLIDSFWPLIIMYSAFNMAWVTLIMNNYFNMLPSEMEDAARVDGCTRFGAFWRVLLPMAVPGLVSVTIISFLFSWGEFLYALLFTTSASTRTMPIAISMFVGQFAVEYRMLAAGLVIGILPPVLLALLFQRFIVAGLTQGGLKG